jgi:hypothetical protein
LFKDIHGIHVWRQLILSKNYDNTSTVSFLFWIGSLVGFHSHGCLGIRLSPVFSRHNAYAFVARSQSMAVGNFDDNSFFIFDL